VSSVAASRGSASSRASSHKGPVSEFVPGSILQTAPTDYTILGGVADDVEIHIA
jgi:glucosamine-6-phosphate deaminase